MSSERFCVCGFVCFVFLEAVFLLALKIRQAAEGRTWQVPAQVEILSVAALSGTHCWYIQTLVRSVWAFKPEQKVPQQQVSVLKRSQWKPPQPHTWPSNPISVNSWAMEGLGLPCWLGVCAAPQCVKAEKGWSHKVLWAPPHPNFPRRNSIHGGLGQCGCCSQAKQWPLAAISQLNKYYHVGFPDLPCSCLL